MAEMFLLLMSIFCLSTVVQSDNELVARIMVDKYILDHSFLRDFDPNEIVDSLTLDTSVIGTEFKEYQNEPQFVELATSGAKMNLERLQRNYQRLINTNSLFGQILQVSLDTCGVSEHLKLLIDRCKLHTSVILDELLNEILHLSEPMQEDLINIRAHLFNIRPPEVTDIASLKKNVNLFIVLIALLFTL